MSNKKLVAILYGGRSVEHEISINSAKNIYEFIDKNLFDVVLIGISKNGSWHITDEVNGNFEDDEPLSLQLTPGAAIFKNDVVRFKPDVVFPVLHGTDGEDGSIQGLLQAMNIPFAGSGVLGSAVSMSKLSSKRLLKAAGIPTSEFVTYSYEQIDSIEYENIIDTLGLPFMAKAANLGSSVGVYKVKSRDDFKKAVHECFLFDSTVLFEEFIEGRELECSVLGNADPIASFPAEIVISDAYEFYTYEAKYLDPNAVELHVPAKLEDSIADKIREISTKAYLALHCENFARVDLFLKANGDVLINEINTIPGFTNSSMFPMMWKERGISFTELITKIIHMANEKSNALNRLKKER